MNLLVTVTDENDEVLAEKRILQDGSDHEGSKAVVRLLETTFTPELSLNSFMVITGNPVDGLFYNGPFADSELAFEWANSEHNGEDWWIAVLHSPDGEAE